MTRPRSLHELLSDALERAAEAHEESHELVERQRALTDALDETIECLKRRRRERTTFGNGHRGAGGRSRPG